MMGLSESKETLIPILWMDDNPGGIGSLARVLQSEGVTLDVDIAASIQEARERLQTKEYAAFVVDCQMDSIDPATHNGADFLLEVNEQKKWLPTFVYTAFRDDILYEERIQKSNAIAIAEKVGIFGKPLGENPFFKSIYIHARGCYKVIGKRPEEIQFQDYLADPSRYREEVAAHWIRHGVWITKELNRKGLVWGVVCGDQIVKGSPNLPDFPTREELHEIGKKTNLVPFTYSIAEEPEMIDSPEPLGVTWNHTQYQSDYFPTLKVCIGGHVLTDDFDTGAYQTQVSDEIVPRGLLDAVQEKDSVHLDHTFRFFTKKVEVTLFDDDGRERSASIPVRVVIDWPESPFVRVNKERQVLLGRDLLRAFSVEVVLNSEERVTKVRHLATLPDRQSVRPVRKRLYPMIEPNRTGWLSVSDIHTLYYEECGNLSGKPVVVLHGGPGSGISTRSRQFFDPDRYRIVLYDQRGAGQSTPHASLEDNTTWHLVEDLEKLRRHLGIKRWQVFGGSWGSTLALAYAQSYPRVVSELILRGIFMLRRSELEWFYQRGADALYPDCWEEYLAPIPEEERDDMIRAYQRRLNSENKDERLQVARAWSMWEARMSSIIPDDEKLNRAKGDKFSLAFARIENHYFVHGGFFEPEDQLLRNIDRIRHIPAVIVQGRYDLVCPMKTAWDLVKNWLEADFRVVTDAGHSAFEPGIVHELVSATNEFARR